MGYDNECIVSIQSLAGEYFCPVCRTLVYPNEALQSQCTHLYCKPCLAYVVATTHACPYDGFLVTEADSKPLMESSKELGETIGKVAVYCLFHRSGCQWQGTLAESTAHCVGCNYGNSPVVCNRCGTQIVHRQVQEHAQICPGIQPQAQQVENQQAQASSLPNQSSADAATTTVASTAVTTTAPSADAAHSATVSSVPASIPAAASATSGPAQAQGGAVVYPQAPAPGQTPEQWYQLQYQQYYQQYPGYDPYQQQYQQQYAQYQLQPGYPPHVQPQMQAAAPQHVQPQPYMQPQPQAQPQLQAVQPQVQQQPHHPQLQPHLPAQVPPMQAQAQPQQMPLPQQPYPHAQPQAHPPHHGHVAGQPYPQPQPHATHTRPPQLPGPPLQHQQQPMPPPQQLQQQMPHPHSHPHPHPQHGLRPQHPPSQPQQPPIQMQPQPQPHPHAQPVPQMQPSNPPAHAVSGFQSYPQSNPGVPQQQRPIQMHHSQQQGMPTQQHPPPQGQFPHQQPPQMRPPHSQMPMPAQQPLGMPPPQGPPPNLYPPQQQVQHPTHQSGQQVYQQPGFPLQQIHPQQSTRPQGAPYTQQPVPGHPHHQGLPPTHAHSRPMMQQPVPQSPGAVHNKFTQPGMTQQSPNQSSMGRNTPLLPTSSEQQSQLPLPGSQGGLFSGSHVTPKQGASTPDKVSQIPPEGTKSGENSKHMGDEVKGTVEAEKDAQVENENKILFESLGKEENVGHPLLRQVKEEEGANISSEFQGRESKPDDKSGSVKGDDAHPVSEGTAMVQNQPGSNKVMHGESQNIERPNQGSVTGNQMHPAQQLPPPGVLERGQVQKQPTQQNIHPAQGGVYPRPGFNEQNPTYFPQQYTGPDDRRGMPPGGPQQQQILYGHPPHMPDPTMMLQRPPAPPDRMFPQPMPQSSQERRFPEPLPNQMHVQGQTVPPSHMRPPGQNAPDAFAHQGTPAVPQEPFWPPPHAGVPAQNLPPPPPGRGPGQHGFPPKGFEQQAMGPPQGQTHLMPHAGGARPPPGDPSAWPVMGGPPPGDSSSRMIGGPPFIPSNRAEAEAHGIKRPGVYDGRQLEPHRPVPSDRASYGQPNVLKANGMSNNVPVGGMHEDRFRPMPEERFKPFHEEGYKAHPDEHFRPPMLDPARHIADRREFEEDLKQFPRPAYLDGDGPPRFDGYLSSSRPLDRMTGANVPPSSRPLPSIGSSEFHPDIGERDRPILFHDHLVRKHEGNIAHPDRSNLVSEFGRHRLDNLPPLQSPGHFGGEFPDRMPGHLRRGMDGHGPLGHGLPSDLRGIETVDSQNLPSFSRGGSFGGFRSHVGIGEPGGPGNMPLHLRGSREGDMDPFEQSRKRKMGNMVRCLICKIDCETVEGLELHSQTREHQKMAMDVVLSIKKDNAKKHKLTAENTTSFEGANKSRKSSFEKRGNRQ